MGMEAIRAPQPGAEGIGAIRAPQEGHGGAGAIRAPQEGHGGAGGDGAIRAPQPGAGGDGAAEGGEAIRAPQEGKGYRAYRDVTWLLCLNTLIALAVGSAVAVVCGDFIASLLLASQALCVSLTLRVVVIIEKLSQRR